jgi:hypothetical protein
MFNSHKPKYKKKPKQEVSIAEPMTIMEFYEMAQIHEQQEEQKKLKRTGIIVLFSSMTISFLLGALIF